MYEVMIEMSEKDYFPHKTEVVFRGDRHITLFRSLRYNAFSGRIQPSRLSLDDRTSLHGSQESDNNVQCVGGVVGIYIPLSCFLFLV